LKKRQKKQFDMKTSVKQPKITLVGAGPGDLELITLKGLKAIRQADVILYDALVNEELLNESPKAKHIFVGKRKGFKAMSQDEINKLIVDQAIKFGNVVRLKGGDSFVFGRGYEEIQYAGLFGIPTEVVPGISSSIAVPALAGIPVTHRGISNSFTVITATLSDGSMNPEILQLPQLNGTFVILMGLSKLKEIADVFVAAGRANEAFGIISNGSLSDQQVITSTAENISSLAEKQKVKAPAIIVIGDVVVLSQENETRNLTFLNYN
jgi:uroporphyrin-III C-methyltransferase